MEPWWNDTDEGNPIRLKHEFYVYQMQQAKLQFFYLNAFVRTRLEGGSSSAERNKQQPNLIYFFLKIFFYLTALRNIFDVLHLSQGLISLSLPATVLNA
jgi:hypothetical protein